MSSGGGDGDGGRGRDRGESSSLWSNHGLGDDDSSTTTTSGDDDVDLTMDEMRRDIDVQLQRFASRQIIQGEQRDGDDISSGANYRNFVLTMMATAGMGMGDEDGDGESEVHRSRSHRVLRSMAMALGIDEDHAGIEVLLSEGNNLFPSLGEVLDLSSLQQQPPVDVRRPDQLVCPTCMKVHSPVEGTEKIEIPKQGGREGEEGADAESVFDSSTQGLFPAAALYGAEPRTRSDSIDESSTGSSMPPLEDINDDIRDTQTQPQPSEILNDGNISEDEVVEDLSHSSDDDESETMPPLEDMADKRTDVKLQTEDGYVVSNNENAVAAVVDDETESLDANANDEGEYDAETQSSISEILNGDNQNLDEESSSYSISEISSGDEEDEGVGEEDTSASELSSDESSSMPLLHERTSIISDDSSSDESSILAAMRPAIQQRDRSSSGPQRNNNEGLGVSPFLRFLVESQSGREMSNNNVHSNNNDRRPSNPLTRLRDYGAIRVFASATCPICLDEHNPIVALKCGHAVCECDYEQLGGYLASDKDECKRRARAGTGQAVHHERTNDVRSNTAARGEVSTTDQVAASTLGRSVGNGDSGIPSSVSIEHADDMDDDDWMHDEVLIL